VAVPICSDVEVLRPAPVGIQRPPDKPSRGVRRRQRSGRGHRTVVHPRVIAATVDRRGRYARTELFGTWGAAIDIVSARTYGWIDTDRVIVRWAERGSIRACNFGAGSRLAANKYASRGATRPEVLPGGRGHAVAVACAAAAGGSA